MRISDLKRLLDAAYSSTPKRSVYIEGPPGCGKSECVRQFADFWRMALVVRHPVLEEPVDARGIPAVAGTNGDRHTLWCRPDYVPTDPDSKGVFFIDELPQAEPAMQKAYGRTLLERVVGETRLPEGWLVVAAGNRAQDRAGAGRLFSHVKNRVIRVQLEVSNDDWQEWALASGVVKEVRGYLRFCPSDLFDFEPGRDEQNATPRSWAMVSDIYPHLPEDLRHAAVAGCVGDGPAAKFCAFCRLSDKLPDIDECLRKPDTCKLPAGQLDILHAFVVAVGDRCKDAKTATATAALTIAMRLTQDEFSVLLCKDVVGASKGAWKSSPKRQAVLDRHKSLLLADAK